MSAGGARAGGVMVIGLGNEYRGDDGVGLVVARAVGTVCPPQVRVLERAGEGARLLEDWIGAGLAVLVDAVVSGSKPGTIHRLDGQAGPVPVEYFHRSSHAFGLGETVALARALGCLPRRLVIYGVEGKEFGPGRGLSEAVAAAAEEVVRRVCWEVENVEVTA